jgi:ParB family transcriptional regulator, chromosome partitioning protein
MSAEKQRRLGRGLEALIGSAQVGVSASSELQRIPIARIRPNPFQPRREFDPVQLQELEASIRASGLLQPITVRRKGEQYELIAGERRLRAVTNLEWREIPAIVRDFDDQTLLILALVENLQRSDLNAVEEAKGYQRLLGEFSLTHQQVADAVGKDRTTISNLLRVLNLPEPIQKAVAEGKLSTGHARAIAGLPDAQAAMDLADEVIANGLSVRQTEERVRDSRASASSTRKEREHHNEPAGEHSAAARRLQDELRRYLQTDVHIKLGSSSKGTLSIAFYSADDLERIMELIRGEPSPEF